MHSLVSTTVLGDVMTISKSGLSIIFDNLRQKISGFHAALAFAIRLITIAAQHAVTQSDAHLVLEADTLHTSYQQICAMITNAQKKLGLTPAALTNLFAVTKDQIRSRLEDDLLLINS